MLAFAMIKPAYPDSNKLSTEDNFSQVRHVISGQRWRLPRSSYLFLVLRCPQFISSVCTTRIFLLPKRSFLFQLRTPKCLNTVHAWRKFFLGDIEVLLQYGAFFVQVGDLRLKFKDQSLSCVHVFGLIRDILRLWGEILVINSPRSVQVCCGVVAIGGAAWTEVGHISIAS